MDDDDDDDDNRGPGGGGPPGAPCLVLAIEDGCPDDEDEEPTPLPNESALAAVEVSPDAQLPPAYPTPESEVPPLLPSSSGLEVAGSHRRLPRPEDLEPKKLTFQPQPLEVLASPTTDLSEKEMMKQRLRQGRLEHKA